MKDGKTKRKCDWENHEHTSRVAYGMRQDKKVFHPCEGSGWLDDVWYVVWDMGFKPPALGWPRNHPLLRRHGIESVCKTRLLIEGNIDFMVDVGGTNLVIEIDESGDEREYLKVLLDALEQAKSVIKDRLAHLKRRKEKCDGE